MLKIKQNKEKLILVMTQDEHDETFANQLKKFSKHKDFLNILRDFKVKFNAEGNISEFATEIKPEEDLGEIAQKLADAKLAIYKLLHTLEWEESLEKEIDANRIGQLFDRVVVVVPIGMFEDHGKKPGTQCPAEEE